uniref:ribbon-helix-helix domain-containing protein n=1 Tax=Argonema antarcticum TaxID=2942763 RepID=UPI002010D27C
ATVEQSNTEFTLEHSTMQSLILNDDVTTRRKAEIITAYVNPDLKAVLAEWAKQENRSVSSLITHLLANAVEDRQKQVENAN